MQLTPEISKDLYFLSGGGEMGELMRAKDWRNTPLGEPKMWPSSLKTMVAMMLNNPFGMYIAWGDDCIQLYNDGYRPILGSLKHPEALGLSTRKTFDEIWHIIGSMFKDVMNGKAFDSIDLMFSLNRNGFVEECYFDFAYSPIIKEDGIVGGVLVTVIETTERIRSGEALTESETRFRTMAENVPNLMWMADADGNIYWYNQRWYEYTGATPEQMEGWGWQSVHCPKKLPEVVKKWKESIEKGISFEMVFPLKGINGKFRQFLTRVLPIQNKEGKIIQWVGTNTDITERIDIEDALKESETNLRNTIAINVTIQTIARQKIESVVAERTKELKETNKSLQKSNAELAQFAYIASHDLQEPLRKISTYSEMLERNLPNSLDEKSKGYLSKINHASLRMKTLIRDVLAYSAMVKVNEVFVLADLNLVIENIIKDYELLIEEKGANIIYSHLPSLEAIPLQMSQLFGNLIGNALKFARKDVKPVINISSVPLTSSELKDLSFDNNLSYFRIQFQDNGIGFKPEYTEQIFNIFQRLHSKSEYEGTGIGLAMCKKVVLNHKGAINAKGSSEKGAIFNIILPFTQKK